MQMLDYRPNKLARALATGRSRMLGVVSFDTTLYGPASTLAGIERAAQEHDYFVSNVSAASLDRPAVLQAVERLRAQGVEGIMVIAPRLAAAAALTQLPDDVPVVAAEAGPHDALPVVAVDHMAGAAAATRHLLDLGHPTVHHIAGPADWIEAEQRLSGWRATLEDAGVPAATPLIGDWSAQSGYELASRLMCNPDVSAVFVGNDQMALGVLRFLHEQGCTLPDEVSVVGFDDIPEAAYFWPPLTTVRQDFMEMGRRALHLLLGEIESGTRSLRRESIPAELIVRGSSGPRVA
jgi:DNA-binding LacI/PurR family transcriptional regulator